MRISRLGETSQLTTLLALQCFFPFKADDWNRNQRGGGVYPADRKHRIEDQAHKGYAGKVGTRISIRLSAPKAKSTGLRARHEEKRARAHSTTIQISVTTCNRTIWRDISTEVAAHPEAWVNVPPQIWCAKVPNCALRLPAALPQLDDTVSRIQECLNPGPRVFKGGKQHVIAAIAEAHPNQTRFVLWSRREV